MSWIENFIYEYFIQPIELRTGYNIVNTITYGLILIVALFGIYKLLKKLHLQINTQFVSAIVPFIFIGTTVRVLVDADVFPYSIFLISPGIYIVISGFCILSILTGLLVEKSLKVPYWQFTGGIGLAGAVYFGILVLTKIRFVDAILFILGLTGTLFLGYYLACKTLKVNFLLNGANLSLVCVHIFDASATYIGVTYFGYFEQHAVPRFAIQLIGSAAIMFPLKIIVVILAIYLIEKFGSEDHMLKNLLKLAIFILGLSPGLRDTFRIAMGV